MLSYAEFPVDPPSPPALDKIIVAEIEKPFVDKLEYQNSPPSMPMIGTRAQPSAVVGRHSRPAETLPKASVVVDSQSPLTGPQERIINGLRWLETLGIERATNVQAAFAAQYSPTSTSYTNPRGELLKRGLIVYPTAGTLSLTSSGRALAAPHNRPSSNSDLHARILEQLPGPERKILEVLLDFYPAEINNEQLAAKSNYSHTSTSYTNPRGKLMKLGLIEYPYAGVVRASDGLFPMEH